MTPDKDDGHGMGREEYLARREEEQGRRIKELVGEVGRLNKMISSQNAKIGDLKAIKEKQREVIKAQDDLIAWLKHDVEELGRQNRDLNAIIARMGATIEEQRDISLSGEQDRIALRKEKDALSAAVEDRDAIIGGQRAIIKDQEQAIKAQHGEIQSLVNENVGLKKRLNALNGLGGLIEDTLDAARAAAHEFRRLQ